MGDSGRKRNRRWKNRCKNDVQTCLQILDKTDERNPPFLGQFICLARSLQTESLPQGHLARNMWQFGTVSVSGPVKQQQNKGPKRLFRSGIKFISPDAGPRGIGRSGATLKPGCKWHRAPASAAL
jgi:hypothetical protein